MTSHSQKLIETFEKKTDETIKLATKYSLAVCKLSHFVKRDSEVLREIDKLCHDIKTKRRNMEHRREIVASLVKTGRKMVSYFPLLQKQWSGRLFRAQPKMDDMGKEVFSAAREYFSSLISLNNEFVRIALRYYRTKKEDEMRDIELAVTHKKDAVGMRVLDERVSIINTVSRKKGHMLLNFDLEASQEKIM
jgi:hypothetical protein